MAATFTNISGADLYVLDEYGRAVKFTAGETKTAQSDFLFNYTSQATGQANTAASVNAAALDPVLSSTGTAPTNMPGPNINPNNVIGAGRLDGSYKRKQLSVQMVDAAPATTDDDGLYSDGSDVWVVANGAVITVS